jgi:hypothetical protein
MVCSSSKLCKPIPLTTVSQVFAVYYLINFNVNVNISTCCGEKIQLEECFIYDFSLCTDHLLMFGLCTYHLPLLFSYQNLTHNELAVTPLLPWQLSPCSHCHHSLVGTTLSLLPLSRCHHTLAVTYHHLIGSWPTRVRRREKRTRERDKGVSDDMVSQIDMCTTLARL